MKFNSVARNEDWKRAQAGFNQWPEVGKACDGTPIRRDPSGWGDGVYEIESGMVVSPIAYAARREVRRLHGFAIGDRLPPR